MKKAIVASILGLAGSIATTYGQGIILFDNYDSKTFQPVVYGAGVNGQVAGSNVNSPTVEVALFYALGTYSSVSSFMSAATDVLTTSIDTTKNNPNQGFGGTGPGGYYDDGTAAVLPGWTTSQTATFLTEGWESGPGNALTFANATIK
jgi:hypothetical protein